MPLLYCQAVKVGLNIMRNKSLDAGKAMAAFGVVFIHVSFPGQTGQIIKALARSAVPFFFMVSGYFCYYNRRNTDRGKRITDKIPAKVQHILTLLAFALLFYLLWESAMHLVEKEAIGPWLQERLRLLPMIINGFVAGIYLTALTGSWMSFLKIIFPDQM